MKKTAAIMILAALVCALSSCRKKPISADYVKSVEFSVFTPAEFL